MSDIWSDMKQRAFINIIAYSPGGAVFMRSIDVSQERKTGFFLKQIFSAVIEEIGPNHVVQFITNNATNFESTGDMLIANCDYLLHLFDWRGFDHSKKDIAKDVASIIQSAEFWSQGQELLLVLEPLVRVLRLVDGDLSTTGYLYEAMEMAKETIKQHGTFTENREMKEGISFILENLVALEEKIEFMGQVQLFRMKLSSLFTETAMTMLKTSHPRIWWDFCGDRLPILQKYAIRILSQPCSSTSCERYWNASEAAQTKKRNRPTPKMLDDLVYVRMNTMMIEKFNTLEARDVEPIDLDKLNELPEHG
ncbi:uncharacterized protein LOC142615390 [Castanea sativa]|uniref:uncharacterized protein LOC142615390 n=1 Tax=Castanea sativa TaxID=21020 RepID=UPI003F6521C7